MEYFAYSQKAFLYKYVVMLSDTDQFQHMSFANYLKLMFLATDALCVSCFNQEFLNQYRLKLVQSRMQFKRQTSSGNHLLIKVNCAVTNGSQFSLLYTFVIEGSGELVALGRQSYEIQEKEDRLSSRIPNNLLNLLEPIRVDEKHLVYKY